MAVRIIKTENTPDPEKPNEVSSGPLDDEAVSRVLEWYMQQIDSYDDIDKFNFFFKPMNSSRMTSLLSFMSLRTHLKLGKELLKRYAEICMTLDKFPEFNSKFAATP